MKKLYINEAYCMGCRLCEIYCAYSHSGIDNIIKAFKDEVVPPPGLVVEELDHTSFALHCAHSTHPDCRCISACITGALYKDENGYVQHDPNKCIGCYMCVMSCPLGVIQISSLGKKIISKCDRCIEFDVPACVKNCPNEAIMVIEEEEKDTIKKAIGIEKKKHTILDKKNSKFIIIGSGIAGIRAAEIFDKYGLTQEILIITADDYIGYSKPLITYELGGLLDANNLSLRKTEFFNKFNIHTGERVKSIDSKNKKIFTDKGEYGYEYLLITGGGVPIIPPIKGVNTKSTNQTQNPASLDFTLPGLFTFTTKRDEFKINEYIKTHHSKKAIIIGAGFIGLKAAEALKHRGFIIDIIEMADKIFPNSIDEKAADIVHEFLKRKKFNVHFNKKVSEIKKGKGDTLDIITKDNDTYNADIVILASGVKPNISFLEGSKIEISRGIIINERSETSIKDIYAAGDIAVSFNFFDGKRDNTAIWPIAYMQGETAAINMIISYLEKAYNGKEAITKKLEKKIYHGNIAMNSTVLDKELAIVSIGINPNDAESIVSIDRKNMRYRRITIKNNTVIGVIFINDIERAGIFTSFIKNKVNVSSFKDRMLDENFGIVYLPKNYKKEFINEFSVEL